MVGKSAEYVGFVGCGLDRGRHIVAGRFERCFTEAVRSHFRTRKTSYVIVGSGKPASQPSKIARKRTNIIIRFTQRAPIFIATLLDRKTGKSLHSPTCIDGVYKRVVTEMLHQYQSGAFLWVGAGLFNLSVPFKAVGEPAPTGF